MTSRWQPVRTEPDHLLYQGANDTIEFIVRRYDNGDVTLSTRPLGGHGWSPEIELTVVPLGAIA